MMPIENIEERNMEHSDIETFRIHLSRESVDDIESSSNGSMEEEKASSDNNDDDDYYIFEGI
jgi:hypothetical protein